jgi:hypothetical protein
MDVLVLFACGVVMGIVAVTAGGGATIGVPLVMLAGYPATTALVSVKVALLGSFVTGAIGYKGTNSNGKKLPAYLWPLSIVGSVVGANLVLDISTEALKITILSLLVGTLVLSVAVKPPAENGARHTSLRSRVIGSVVVFFLSVYSGFFGAGTGSFLMFSLMYFFGYSYLAGASVTTSISLLMTAASIVTFFFYGGVDITVTVSIAAGCLVGGLCGARLARLGGNKFIHRTLVVATTLLVFKLGYETTQAFRV